jgi:hypothetical protein
MGWSCLGLVWSGLGKVCTVHVLVRGWSELDICHISGGLGKGCVGMGCVGHRIG